MFIKKLSLLSIVLHSILVKGYPDCTKGTESVYEDKTGKWGVNNGDWCYIEKYEACPFGTKFHSEDENAKWGVINNKRCYIDEDITAIASNGVTYPFCKDYIKKIQYTDNDGIWGVQDDDWCLFKKSNDNCKTAYHVENEINGKYYSIENGKECQINTEKTNQCNNTGYKCCSTDKVISIDKSGRKYGKESNGEICVFSKRKEVKIPQCKEAYKYESEDNKYYYSIEDGLLCILKPKSDNPLYEVCDTADKVIGFDDYDNIYGRETNGRICIFRLGKNKNLCRTTNEIVDESDFYYFGNENGKECILKVVKRKDEVPPFDYCTSSSTYKILETDGKYYYSTEKGKKCVLKMPYGSGCNNYGYNCCKSNNDVIDEDKFGNQYSKEDGKICIYKDAKKCDKAYKIEDFNDDEHIFYGKENGYKCILNLTYGNGYSGHGYEKCTTTNEIIDKGEYGKYYGKEKNGDICFIVFDKCDTSNLKLIDVKGTDKYGRLLGEDKNGQICVFEDKNGCEGTGLPCCNGTNGNDIVKKIDESTNRSFGYNDVKDDDTNETYKVLCLFKSIGPNGHHFDDCIYATQRNETGADGTIYGEEDGHRCIIPQDVYENQIKDCWSVEIGDHDIKCCKSRDVEVLYQLSDTERFGMEDGRLCGIRND